MNPQQIWDAALREAGEKSSPDRALSDLVHFCQVSGKRLEIIFTPASPVTFPVNGVDIPHSWRVRIQDPKRPDPDYLGWGVTINDAILDCYRHWQKGETL